MTNPFTGRAILPFLDNKKTYLMAGGVVVCGALQAFGVHVPDWIIYILGGSAIITHRASVTNISNAIDDIGAMITYIPEDTVHAQNTQANAVQKAVAVAKSVEYKNSPTEEAKTELLNESQSTKGIKL